MKKFRFLIFMLALTSIFIGCAEPTDDSVIPEVPKTTSEEENTTEVELTNDQLYSLAKIPINEGSSLFHKDFTIESTNRKFTINTALLYYGLQVEYLNENYKITITDWGGCVNISVEADSNNTSITAGYEAIIISNIKQIYVEVK